MVTLEVRAADGRENMTCVFFFFGHGHLAFLPLFIDLWKGLVFIYTMRYPVTEWAQCITSHIWNVLGMIIASVFTPNLVHPLFFFFFFLDPRNPWPPGSVTSRKLVITGILWENEDQTQSTLMEQPPKPTRWDERASLRSRLASKTSAVQGQGGKVSA